jgi:hypothetical protein
MHLFCNIQSQARTHAVLVIGLWYCLTFMTSDLQTFLPLKLSNMMFISKYRTVLNTFYCDVLCCFLTTKLDLSRGAGWLNELGRCIPDEGYSRNTSWTLN